MSARVHDRFCTLLPDHPGPCEEHYCDCDDCGRNARGRLAELERRVGELEAALAAAGLPLPERP